jgi:hypothetical protein
MAAFNTSGLPPVLTKLLAPWLDAIEASEPGMGNHVMAIAEHCVDALRYRIEMTPLLEQAIFDARAITNTLAGIVDDRHSVPIYIRTGARGALANLIDALQRATPNAVTRELGLGW